MTREGKAMFSTVIRQRIPDRRAALLLLGALLVLPRRSGVSAAWPHLFSSNASEDSASRPAVDAGYPEAR
tara:strand:- start:256 stop:465 length:210 start_codon:yes stop_codon:yes gene_type:complete